MSSFKKCLFSFVIIFFSVNICCLAKKDTKYKIEAELVPLFLQTNDSVLQPSCVRLSGELLKRGKQLNDHLAQSYSFYFLSIYYYQTGNIKELLKAIEESKKVCNNDNCVKCLYTTWNNAVTLHLNKYEYTKAIEQLEKMQKYALKYNHSFGIMKSYYGLGNCYAIQRQYAKAYQEYNKSLDIARQNKIAVAGGDYVNMAQVAIQIHKYDEAEKLLLEAAAQKDIPKFMKIHIYALLFNIYSMPDHNDMEKALHYKNLLENEQPDEKTYTEASYIACNEAYFNFYTYLKHDYAEAEKHIVADTDSMAYYVRKAENMKLQNKNKGALDYYERAISFYSTHQDSEEKKELENFAIKNDLDKAIENQNILKFQNVQFKEKWQRIFIICGCIAFVIVVSLMSLYFVVRMRKMRKSKEQAEISERRKTLFLQNMSHEIRTPLNAIVGFTDLLTSETQGLLSPEERNMMVNLVQSNSELLGTLVNDILDVSKFESGTYHLNFSDMNVFELCGATVETVRMRVQPGVELIYQPGDKDITLHTDAQRVQQVIINYLTNACKYTSQGSITMAYEVMDDIIRFTVTDTGMGIKPEDAEEVFKRFQMLDSKVSGIGLGLHICRLISNLVHGRVYVDTSYTGGARFVFDHPLHIEQNT